MNQLSDRLNSLSPSATLAMSQKSSELKAQGVDVINLSVGEPDFNTPDHIKEAAKKAIDENYSRYSPVAGYPALRNAIVAKLKNENGLEYTAAQISCANGAKQSVCNTIMALRSNRSGSLLGELSGNGETGRRYSCHCTCRYRTGFQDYSCSAGSCHHSEHSCPDSLLSV